MARTPSTMLELGTTAPDFSLPCPQRNGGLVNKAELVGRPLLVIFLCNHCPFVLHIKDELMRLSASLEQRGIAVIGINANDVTTHPEDSPEKMKLEGYSFPYLFDESQAVAKAYQAACTPDFFLFDRSHRLVYRGQFDDSRPGNKLPVTGRDLRAAAELLLAGEKISPEQKPSLGCNIKWKAGNAPAYS